MGTKRIHHKFLICDTFGKSYGHVDVANKAEAGNMVYGKCVECNFDDLRKQVKKVKDDEKPDTLGDLTKLYNYQTTNQAAGMPTVPYGILRYYDPQGNVWDFPMYGYPGMILAKGWVNPDESVSIEFRQGPQPNTGEIPPPQAP